MSDEVMSARHDSGADVAAYALGALDQAETRAFERHLENCAICTEELEAFGPVVDALAMSAPEHPVPPGLRRRVIAGVRSESSPDHASRPRHHWAGIGRWSGVRPARRSIATAVTLGLAAVAIAIAMLVPGGSGDVRVLEARVVDSPGSAQVRLADGRVELIVRHFPLPAAGDVYEVWLKRPTGPPEPARVLFSVTAQGAGDIGVPDASHGAKEILVTEEPAGGTLVPTHRPVIVGRLS